MKDYYRCDNPDCGYVLNHYTRFCPQCDCEKSMVLVPNGFVRDVVLDIISMTSKMELGTICKLSGATLTHTDLIEEVIKAFS